VIVASLLNLKATASFVMEKKPSHLLLVCAGTGETAALEDTLAAGALCDWLIAASASADLRDSAEIALRLYRHAGSDFPAAVRSSQNARCLLANADLRDDVEFCLRRDCYSFAAVLGPDGVVSQSSARATI